MTTPGSDEARGGTGHGGHLENEASFQKAKKKNWVGFHADYALEARAGHGGATTRTQRTCLFGQSGHEEEEVILIRVLGIGNLRAKEKGLYHTQGEGLLRETGVRARGRRWGEEGWDCQQTASKPVGALLLPPWLPGWGPQHQGIRGRHKSKVKTGRSPCW